MLVASSLSLSARNLPDPVRLVHRINVLEDTMKGLAVDCTEIEETKRALVLSLLQLQVENVALLREVRNRCMMQTGSGSCTSQLYSFVAIVLI